MASLPIEQTTATPSIRISGVGSPGIDGRTTTTTLYLNGILLTESLGRLSLPNSTNEVFLDDDPSEDWTRTTAEKDSWAYRERRRSSMWQKIDSYPSLYSSESSPSRSRRGSILSIFTHGKDKDGNDVLNSGDGDLEGWNNGSLVDASQPSSKESPNKAPTFVRPEGMPMPWIRGKDNQGRDVVLWIQYE